MKIKLKDCPFCGGVSDFRVLYADYTQAYCRRCGCSSKLLQIKYDGLDDNKIEVLTKLSDIWNSRVK